MNIFNCDIYISTIKLLAFCLLCGIIIFIIVSYCIIKILRLSINDNSIFFYKYNKKTQNVLDKYGDCKISKIYLCREPLTNIAYLIMNILTFYNFEKLIKTWSLDCYPYHSKFIIKLITLKGRTKFILLDKNNCINITTDFNINDKQECKQININSHWTLNNILTQTLNRIGNNNFFNWNICKNNCLVFSREILTTLNKLNKSNTSFLSCDKIFGHLEMTEFTLHTINCLNVILNVVEKYIFDNSILNC